MTLPFARRLRPVLVAAAAGLLPILPACAQSDGQAPVGDANCRPADALSAQMVQELRLIVSSTDSAEAELRRRTGIVYQPLAPVLFVSDEPVCLLAVRALNARTRTPGRRRQVYVYDLGGQYAAEDPEQRAGEFRMVRIFSRQWELRGDVLVE